MQSLSEDEKRQVLGSLLADQLSAIQEAVKDVPEIKNKVDHLDQVLLELSSNMSIVKAAITDLSNQVNDHDHQINRLRADVLKN